MGIQLIKLSVILKLYLVNVFLAGHIRQAWVTTVLDKLNY